MTPPINDQLRSITTFPQLVDYLCDELDWPIDADDFESYTFEWDAAEDLGVAPEHAAKINEIKQLRPLSSNQPWGIFFIEFEPKKLPVVVLRRLLNKLVTKQRASANPADRQTWDQDDLLFISSFGEQTDSPELAFAHFHHDEGDLPTLRVLGWDGSDTPLKLDQVNRDLHARLRWPDDDADLDEWRTQWSGAFKHRIGHTIQTADMLAKVLAELAKSIRDRCQTLIAAEPENGPLKQLFKAFRSALIHDLTEETFADTYAQTITYGLLTAAISRTDRTGGGGTALQADNITDMVPVTNPFLKEMLQSFLQAGGRTGGLDFDELGVQDVVELLRDEEQTDLAAVLRDFGNRNPNEDPVIRFYEHFLAAYNKELKVKRGVFYTPQPVVSYIVRSVHELLQTEFDLEDGLASTVTWGEMIQKTPDLKLPPLTDKHGEKRTIDPKEFFVQILDPATGTGTFIVEVIDVIHKHLEAKWRKGGISAMPALSGFKSQVSSFESWWNEYVPAALLPRLYAYELLMAPYAIAHMKIGLKLHETGYRFGSDERVRVYLTNALEPKVQQIPTIGFEALAHEAEAVNEVKWYKRFSVILGNPPYSGHSWNLTPDLRKLVETYRFVAGTRIREKGALQFEKSIQEDYVKFLRLAQTKIDELGVGLVGFVTSHGCLDNPTLRGLRYSLLESFDEINVLDMHGNVSRGEQCPSGTPDENVFDIKKTGAAISLLRKHAKTDFGSISVQNLWGLQDEKYQWLLGHTLHNTKRTKLDPSAPFFLFVYENLEAKDEYERGFSIAEILPVHSKGVVTGRDAFVSDFDEHSILERMGEFIDASKTDAELIEKYNLNQTAWWHVGDARQSMPPIAELQDFLQPMLYRPFDKRVCFYHPSVFMSPRRPVMQHFDNNKENLLLVTSRMTKGESFAHVTVSKGLAEAILLSSKTSNNAMIFPVFLSSVPSEEFQFEKQGHRPAFSRKFLEMVELKTSLKVGSSVSGDLQSTIGARDIFNYIFTILHSPSYRIRYREFLKRDFPRVPLTSNLDLFRALAAFGEELVALHLMEAPTLDNLITNFVGEIQQVSKVGWTDNNGGTVWIDGGGTKKAPTAGTSGFHGVPSEVWNFHIGGYQVCEKWLKDRGPKKGKPGRTLTDDDINHYHKIVVALSETIRLMAEIDEVIETHGGWPDAFATTAQDGAE